MSYKKFFLFFIVIAAVSLAVSFKLYQANLPIATVNGYKIRSSEFHTALSAMRNYYETAAKTYGDTRDFSSPEVMLDLRRATLEQLIVNALIRDGLKKRLLDSYGAVLGNKLRGAEANENFKQAALAIYGISFPELKNNILIPMAEAELLEGKLFLEKISLEEWVKAAKESANVSILDSAFAWSKNGVTLR